MKTKEAKQKELAIDVALEIVYGCDRLDRTDLREIIDQEGFNAKEMMKETMLELKRLNAKSYRCSSKFMNEQLAYWYEPWK